MLWNEYFFHGLESDQMDINPKVMFENTQAKSNGKNLTHLSAQPLFLKPLLAKLSNCCYVGCFKASLFSFSVIKTSVLIPPYFLEPFCTISRSQLDFLIFSPFVFEKSPSQKFLIFIRFSLVIEIHFKKLFHKLAQNALVVFWVLNTCCDNLQF